MAQIFNAKTPSGQDAKKGIDETRIHCADHGFIRRVDPICLDLVEPIKYENQIDQHFDRIDIHCIADRDPICRHRIFRAFGSR